MLNRRTVGRMIRNVGRGFGWTALLLLLFTMLTGYGISQFRIVSGLTFEILNKAVSHRLHHYVEIPLLVVTLTHVCIAVWGRLVASRGKELGHEGDDAHG